MTLTILVVGARGIPDVEGGAEKNAERLFPAVVAHGYRVVLLGLAGQVVSGGVFKGVELIAAPRSSFLGTDKLLYYASALFTALRLRPDIVHLQGLGAALFLWAYKLFGFKVVVRYGSADYILDKWGFFGKLGFLASEIQLRFADAVIAVSPSLARRLAQRGITSNVHIIPNARDIRETDGGPVIAHLRPFVFMAGRVTAQKDVATAIAAFRRFEDSTSQPFDFLVAGGLDDGPYVASLQASLRPNIKLLGGLPRSAMPSYFRAATVYVNASVHEGMSNAILEAISNGAPVLVSDIPENRDLALPNHHYFPVGDAEALAHCLAHATESPLLYVVDPANLASWDTVTQKTVDIYRRLTGCEGSFEPEGAIL